MDLNQYLVKKGTSEYNNFKGSEMENEIIEKLYEEVFSEKQYRDISGYEISKNQYKKLSYDLYEFEISLELDDYDNEGYDVGTSHTENATFNASIDLYYNVPNPRGLINIGEGYFISQFTYVDGEIEKVRSVDPGYGSYDSWKLGNATDYYNETYSDIYLKIDNNHLGITPAVTESKKLKKNNVVTMSYFNESKKITTKKVYEVKKPDAKYLLVEATDGFYKTTDLKNINKYKKVNEEKVKKFINNPSNVWKGVQVTDLYINPMVIEEFENPDEKLQIAINEFKRKTGIQLEKVHTTNDNLYLHGQNTKYSVEVTLTHKNGKYEYKSGGVEVLDRDNIPKTKKSMIKTIMTIINNTFH